jgi:ABC-type sugar transport system ATPase subunit
LATSPQLLLFDEPLGPLDRRLKGRMLDLIRDVHRRFETTTLYVTHDFEEAFALAQRVGILVEGRLVQVGSPSDIYRRPLTREAAELSGPVSFLRLEGDGVGATGALGGHALTEGAPSQGELLAVLRPEDVRFAPDPQGPGAVQDCRPLADGWFVRLKVGETILEARSSAGYDTGTPVAVRLPDRIWTVKP